MISPALWVFVPLDGDPNRLAEIRDWFARRFAPRAAVWSIEHGNRGTGYHLNIIAEHALSDAPPGVRVYCERLRAPVRAVAAYITKSSQIPPRHPAYERTTGKLGSWRQVIDAAAPQLPLLLATTINGRASNWSPPPDPTAEENYQERAHRFLSHLYNLNERQQRTTHGTIDDHTNPPIIDL
jgi:hypothetical protein